MTIGPRRHGAAARRVRSVVPRLAAAAVASCALAYGHVHAAPGPTRTADPVPPAQGGVTAGPSFDPALVRALREVERARGEDDDPAVVSALLYLADRSESAELRRLALDRDGGALAAADRARRVVERLEAHAARSQPALLAEAEALRAAGHLTRVEAFRVANVVRVDGTPAAVESLALRPEVERAYLNRPIVGPGPDPGARPPGEAPRRRVLRAGAGEATPGVAAVRAPEAWALGYDGAGVRVAIVDSGVAGTHSALAGRWAGTADERYAGHPEWAFFDPVLGLDAPYDENGHGTHVAGSAVGGGPGEMIGVAPGATWIAAAVIDRGPLSQTVADALAAFDWLLDPDGDPTTDFDRPDVVVNSWGLVDATGYPDCDDLFWSFVDALEATGAVVLFAAGNEASAGLRRPADRATDDYRSTAIGAIDAHEAGFPTAWFSSRGPTACTPDGTFAIKPDVAGPGVDVRSATPAGGYADRSGTSMATPHVAGVAALVRQANPALSPAEVKSILFQTASDLGPAGEDVETGHGLVDARAAVELALATDTLAFDWPEGRPELVVPAGGTPLLVRIEPDEGDAPPADVRLHWSVDDGPWDDVALEIAGDDAFTGAFPAVDCGATVRWYVSAVVAGSGGTVTSPFDAPLNAWDSRAYAGRSIVFEDDFEADRGWTVENLDLTGGAWERGVPAGDGLRGDPVSDFDDSGACYLTGNAAGDSDVDGGPTMLVSPPLDLSHVTDPEIVYARWFTNDDEDIDDLDVDLSNDDGNTWTVAESVTSGVSWVERRLRVDQVLPPSAAMRLRFRTADQPNDSITEAAIDAVRVEGFVCGSAGGPGDLDGDGVVGFTDLVAVLSDWGGCPPGDPCPADLDGDGQVSFPDLVLLLTLWG